MVIMVDEAPSFGSQIGRSLGQGLGSAGAALAGTAMQKREDKLLKEKYGIDVAGFRGDTRRTLIAEELKRGARKREAESTLPSSTLAGQIGLQDDEEGINDEFMSKPSLKKAVQEEPSVSKSRHILSDVEVEQEGERIARSRLNTANPITLEEGIELAQQRNARNIEYRNMQNTYGKIAEDELSKVLPNASPELQKVFAAKGEEYLRQNLSDTESKRRLATDAKNLTDKLASVAKSLPPKRALTSLKQAILGTGRSDEKTKDSIRAKLLPLKKELGPAYYDTARNILADTGRQPEEIEEIISNLGESTEKTLGDMPKVPKKFNDVLMGGPLGKATKLDEKENEAFQENLGQVLKSDPTVNLILLRKAYEDRGVDWSSFKDAVDQMTLNGQFNPDPEQIKAMDLLDNPPLDRLDAILHHFKFTGR
jgi:hypothetical protein